MAALEASHLASQCTIQPTWFGHRAFDRAVIWTPGAPALGSHDGAYAGARAKAPFDLWGCDENDGEMYACLACQKRITMMMKRRIVGGTGNRPP